MKLAVTSALKLSDEQKNVLSARHELVFCDDSRPFCDQELTVDPSDIEGIICNFFFTHNELSVFENLKVIQLTSAGLDRVPQVLCKNKGIALYTAGDAYAVPMAEWTVAKVLEIVKCTSFFKENQALHRWEKCRQIRELGGMTAAIVGFGNVGKAVAERLKAFGTKILAIDKFEQSALCDEFYNIDELKSAVKLADIVILCLPLTSDTEHIINGDILAAMNDDAVLVNVSRGGVLDTKALIKELENGRFSGVALDVFEKEPLEENSLLWEMDRVLISPHNSFIGDRNNDRLFKIIYNNLCK